LALEQVYSQKKIIFSKMKMVKIASKFFAKYLAKLKIKNKFFEISTKIILQHFKAL
jgi:hypothetical protein